MVIWRINLLEPTDLHRALRHIQVRLRETETPSNIRLGKMDSSRRYTEVRANMHRSSVANTLVADTVRFRLYSDLLTNWYCAVGFVRSDLGRSFIDFVCRSRCVEAAGALVGIFVIDLLFPLQVV
jgi:hypothetical protein